jgi:hypothetical protein
MADVGGPGRGSFGQRFVQGYFEGQVKKNPTVNPLRELMKDALIRHGVYGIVLVNLVLTVLVGLVIHRYFPPVNDLTSLSLMAPKVTLLSVVIALAIVQYSYFYNECREIEERIEKGDYGPLWADYIRTAEESRTKLNSPDARTRFTPEVLNALQINLERMDEAIGRARHEWVVHLRRSLAEFALRFGIIGSIALLIFSSLTLDFVFQVWGLKGLSPEFYSVVTFFMSIILGLIYLIFLVILVQQHIRNYHRTT